MTDTDRLAALLHEKAVRSGWASCVHSPENEWQPWCDVIADLLIAAGVTFQPAAPAEGLRDEPVARLRRALDAHPNATYVRVEAIDLRAALDGEPR